MHIHAIDQSGAVHRIRGVRVLLFVLCLVPVSEVLASIGPHAEIHNKLKSSHSMRRGAGRGAERGKPDGPKRLPRSLGFKCAHCRSEFDSRHAMCHNNNVCCVLKFGREIGPATPGMRKLYLMIASFHFAMMRGLMDQVND